MRCSIRAKIFVPYNTYIETTKCDPYNTYIGTKVLVPVVGQLGQKKIVPKVEDFVSS